MRLIRPATPGQINLALLLVRLVVGMVFVAHGGQKVFVTGLGAVGGGFAQMGVPAGELVGPLVGLVELLGGLAIMTGLMTRLAAMGTTVVMLGAIGLVHLPNGYFNSEFPLALLITSMALAVAGGGSYSMDARLAERMRR